MAKRKADVTSHEIYIDEIDMDFIGETDLLCNKFRDEDMAAIEHKNAGGAKLAKEVIIPEVVYLQHCHYMPGHDQNNPAYGFPAEGIRKSFVNAGRFYAGKKKLTMTKLKGLLTVPTPPEDEGLIRLECGAPELFRKHVGGGALSYRPRFLPWRMRVKVRYGRNLISPEEVLHLFHLASIFVGIGSLSPRAGGNFGTWKTFLAT